MGTRKANEARLTHAQVKADKPTSMALPHWATLGRRPRLCSARPSARLSSAARTPKAHQGQGWLKSLQASDW